MQHGLGVRVEDLEPRGQWLESQLEQFLLKTRAVNSVRGNRNTVGKIPLCWEISRSGRKKVFRCMDHLVLRHPSYRRGFTYPFSFSVNKIRLILSGEAGQALVYLYSEARLYKGARTASLSQSATPRSTGNSSVSEESQPLQHTWNSKGLVLSRSNLLLYNILHFQHLMKTKG